MPLLFTILFLLVTFCAPAAQLAVQVDAEAAIVMNADTGAILYAKNAHKKMHPASITKIATALYALKVKDDSLHDVIAAPRECIGSTTDEANRRSNYTQPAYWLTNDGTHMGIKKGEELPLRDLLFGMMLISANDASNIIAHHVAGSIPVFMDQLNAYLKEIGCKNTTFLNPHGLHHPKHQTTAYDMAVMTREALKHPTFCKIVGTVRHMRPKTNMQEATPIVQSNRLLRNGKYYYPHAIGVKTGYFSKAGHTFVAAARHEGRTLIVVLLKTTYNDKFADAIKLFDAAFKQPQAKRILVKAGPQPHILKLAGTSKSITTYLKQDVIRTYYPAEESKLKCFLYWDAVKLPVAQNQKVGELRFKDPSGHVVLTAPLLAQEDVQANWFNGVKNSIKQLWLSYTLFFFIVLGIVAMALFVFVRR